MDVCVWIHSLIFVKVVKILTSPEEYVRCVVLSKVIHLMFHLLDKVCYTFVYIFKHIYKLFSTASEQLTTLGRL